MRNLLYQLRPPEANVKHTPGGSMPGRTPTKHRDRHMHHIRLLQQYFGPDSRGGYVSQALSNIEELVFFFFSEYKWGNTL